MPSTDWLPSGPSKLPSKRRRSSRQLHGRTDLEVLEAAAAEVRSLVKQLPAVLPAIGSDEANIFRDEARVARRADATTGPTTNTHQQYQSKALSPMREGPPRLFREPPLSYREPSGAGELAAMAEGVLARRRALRGGGGEEDGSEYVGAARERRKIRSLGDDLTSRACERRCYFEASLTRLKTFWATATWPTAVTLVAKQSVRLKRSPSEPPPPWPPTYRAAKRSSPRP